MNESARPEPCGLTRRLLAILYDAVLVVALLFLAAAAALPLGGEQQAFSNLPYTLYLAAVWFSYLGFCWTRSGQTLGMRAWKIRIAPLEGTSLSWPTSLTRFGVSLVSLLALGAGFWSCLLRADRACWHDRASRTRLVRC